MATWKHAIKMGVMSCGILRAWSRLATPRIVVLRYHSVAEDPAVYASTIGTSIIHPAGIFQRQMELLARRYRVITLDEVLRCLVDRMPLPRRAVAITFDDGFRDNYEVAAPILDRLGLRATFYVTTGPVINSANPWFCSLRRAFRSTQSAEWTDRSTGHCYTLRDGPNRTEAFLAACRYCARLTGDSQQAFVHTVLEELGVQETDGDQKLMMDWEQIAALHDRGHIIGSHSVTHPNLAHAVAHEVREELAASKAALEGHLGKPIVHFSYPSPILQPHWTAATVSLTEEVVHPRPRRARG